MRRIRVYAHVAGSRNVARKIFGQWSTDTMLAVNEFIRFRPQFRRPRERKTDDLIARDNGGRVVCRWDTDETVNSTTSLISARRRDAKGRRDTFEDETPRRLRDRSVGTHIYVCPRSVPLTDLTSRIASVTYIREYETRDKTYPVLGAARSNASLRLNDGQPLQ